MLSSNRNNSRFFCNKNLIDRIDKIYWLSICAGIPATCILVINIMRMLQYDKNFNSDFCNTEVTVSQCGSYGYNQTNPDVAACYNDCMDYVGARALVFWSGLADGVFCIPFFTLVGGLAWNKLSDCLPSQSRSRNAGTPIVVSDDDAVIDVKGKSLLNNSFSTFVSNDVSKSLNNYGTNSRDNSGDQPSRRSSCVIL